MCDELVFLGGCATALLITDSAAPPVRATRDVDTLAGIATEAEYHHLEKRLRKRGFEVDTSDGAPICRWVGNGILLDVMPTDERILGFGNAWYGSTKRSMAASPAARTGTVTNKVCSVIGTGTMGISTYEDNARNRPQ
jgi:hypothetical protein